MNMELKEEVYELQQRISKLAGTKHNEAVRLLADAIKEVKGLGI